MKRKFTVPPAFYALLVYIVMILLSILSLKYIPVLAAPIFFSLIITYLFNPLVTYIEEKSRFSRGVISGILIMSLIFVVILLLVNLFPYMIDQLQNAAQKFPDIIRKFSKKIEVFSEYLSKNFSGYIGNIDVMGKIEEFIGGSLLNLSQILLKAFSSLYGVIFTLVYFILIPLFSFYFLKDQGKIEKTFYGLIPHRYRWRFKRKLIKIDRVLSSFIRGQAIVVLILSVLYSIGLSIIGLPFAILIGVFSGFGDIIPYFGTVVGFIVSLIVGFVHFQSIDKLLLIALIFLIIKGSENWYFYPKIVGREVGMHFVWVILSIIIFGQFFGFWGLMFAIPSSAVFKVFIDDFIKYYKESEFFKE
ncbi:MAG: AI-2E family transporter [Acidobacteriota bacterium]